MLSYVLRRLALGGIALFGISIAAFALIHIVPGDPIRAMAPTRATPEQIEFLRDQYGLSDSLPAQYAAFVAGALRLDFGDSIFYNEPVLDLIAPRLVATAQLVVFALLIAVAVTLILGTAAAVHRNRAIDHAVRFLSTLGLAMPAFWIGLLLVLVFSVELGWFPTSGLQDGLGPRLESLVLPAITLSIGVFPLLVRVLRATMIESLGSEFVEAAVARGLSTWRVRYKHALRASLTATLTVLGIFVGALLGGAVVAESVFDLPGLGSLLLQAVSSRDFPVIQTLVLLFGGWVILVNLFTDLAYAIVDPRVRRR